MKTYLIQQPGTEIHALAIDVMQRFHKSLADIPVSLTLIVVEDVDSEGARTGKPALKLHGVAAAAIVKINSLKDRVEGKSDATIFLDGEYWSQASEAEKVAILDHELHHLVEQRDKDGNLIADDAGRPKLKMRPHNFQVGWFHAIAERHGPHAVETQQMQKLAETKWVQGVLNFGG